MDGGSDFLLERQAERHACDDLPEFCLLAEENEERLRHRRRAVEVRVRRARSVDVQIGKHRAVRPLLFERAGVLEPVELGAGGEVADGDLPQSDEDRHPKAVFPFRQEEIVAAGTEAIDLVEARPRWRAKDPICPGIDQKSVGDLEIGPDLAGLAFGWAHGHSPAAWSQSHWRMGLAFTLTAAPPGLLRRAYWSGRGGLPPQA